MTGTRVGNHPPSQSAENGDANEVTLFGRERPSRTAVPQVKSIPVPSPLARLRAPPLSGLGGWLEVSAGARELLLQVPNRAEKRAKKIEKKEQMKRKFQGPLRGITV